MNLFPFILHHGDEYLVEFHLSVNRRGQVVDVVEQTRLEPVVQEEWRVDCVTDGRTVHCQFDSVECCEPILSLRSGFP